jgi:hypothetical protein
MKNTRYINSSKRQKVLYYKVQILKCCFKVKKKKLSYNWKLVSSETSFVSASKLPCNQIRLQPIRTNVLTLSKKLAFFASFFSNLPSAFNFWITKWSRTYRAHMNTRVGKIIDIKLPGKERQIHIK